MQHFFSMMNIFYLFAKHSIGKLFRMALELEPLNNVLLFDYRNGLWKPYVELLQLKKD